MVKQQISSISDLRAKMETMEKNEGNMFFVSDNFGVSRGMDNLFPRVVEPGVPYIVDDNRLGIVASGEVELTVNLIDYTLTPGTIAYVGRGSTAYIRRVGQGFRMRGLVMRDDFMSLALHGRLPSAFCGRELNFYQRVSPDEQAVVEALIDTIWRVVHQDGFSLETVYGLVESLAHYYDSLRQKASTTPFGKPHSREREVFEGFIALVNAHCDASRHLGFYAGQLCLSERHLATVVQKASGHSAKEWIDRAVTTKAKVLLRHTDLQISQIADRLNFPCDSFFCKYFRRLTGLSPTEYRGQTPENIQEEPTP